MRACSTNLARSMGYLSVPSTEEVTFHQHNVTVMGPASSEMRSYHQGETARQAFQKARATFNLAGGRRRSSRTVLYG